MGACTFRTMKTTVALLIGLISSVCFAAKPPIKNSVVPTGVATVAIRSNNPEALKNWYHTNLGMNFEDTPEWSAYTFPKGLRFAIEGVPEKSSPAQTQKQPILARLVVGDIQKSVKEMTAKGVQFIPKDPGGPTVFTRGNYKIATFRDLDGNFLQLIEAVKPKR